MIDVREVAKRISEEIAQGIERYAAVSGMDDPPEQFLSAFVLNQLGNEFAVTVETNSAELWEWNCEMKRLGPRTMPEDYKREMAGCRCDLVLLWGEGPDRSSYPFLALVEFKNWWPSDDDVRKLSEWLRHLDMCPWGLACGFFEETTAAKLLIDEKRASDSATDWVFGRLVEPHAPGRKLRGFRTYARVMSREQVHGHNAG